MGIVESEPRIFKDTIAYNIGYGVGNKTPANKVITISKRVLLHNFIQSLPKASAFLLCFLTQQLTDG